MGEGKRLKRRGRKGLAGKYFSNLNAIYLLNTFRPTKFQV